MSMYSLPSYSRFPCTHYLPTVDVHVLGVDVALPPVGPGGAVGVVVVTLVGALLVVGVSVSVNIN